MPGPETFTDTAGTTLTAHTSNRTWTKNPSDPNWKDCQIMTGGLCRISAQGNAVFVDDTPSFADGWAYILTRNLGANSTSSGRAAGVILRQGPTDSNGVQAWIDGQSAVIAYQNFSSQLGGGVALGRPLDGTNRFLRVVVNGSSVTVRESGFPTQYNEPTTRTSAGRSGIVIFGNDVAPGDNVGFGIDLFDSGQTLNYKSTAAGLLDGTVVANPLTVESDGTIIAGGNYITVKVTGTEQFIVEVDVTAITAASGATDGMAPFLRVWKDGSFLTLGDGGRFQPRLVSTALGSKWWLELYPGQDGTILDTAQSHVFRIYMDGIGQASGAALDRWNGNKPPQCLKISGFYIDNGGTFEIPPAIGGNGVLFYGDSTGEGINVRGNTGNAVADYSATMAFPFLMMQKAKLSGLFLSQVCYGSQGPDVAGTGNVDTWANAWNKMRSGVNRVFNPEPKIIVNVHGINWTTPAASEYLAILNAQRAACPNARIIVITPCNPPGGNASTIQTAWTSFAASDNNTYLYVTQIDHTVDTNDTIHPGINGQIGMADEAHDGLDLQGAWDFETAETPVISPNGGAVTIGQAVTLTTATSGADIYWTDTGIDPTTDDNLYDPLNKPTLDTLGSVDFRAVAVKNGFLDSAVAQATFTVQPPPDTTAPVIASASVPSAGTTVVLNFTESESLPLLPLSGATGFTVRVNGNLRALSSAARTGNAQYTLTPASGTIYSTDTVTASYSQSTGNVTDSAASPNELAAFTNFAVTNNSTQPAPVSNTVNDSVILITLDDARPVERLYLTEGDYDFDVGCVLPLAPGYPATLDADADVSFILRGEDEETAALTLTGTVRYAGGRIVSVSFTEDDPVPAAGKYEAVFRVNSLTVPLGRFIPATIQERLS